MDQKNNRFKRALEILETTASNYCMENFDKKEQWEKDPSF